MLTNWLSGIMDDIYDYYFQLINVENEHVCVCVCVYLKEGKQVFAPLPKPFMPMNRDPSTLTSSEV